MSEARLLSEQPTAIARSTIALALAGAFLAWVLTSTAQGMRDTNEALPRYALCLALATLVALGACLVASRAGRLAEVGRLGWGASVAYLAALKASGLAVAPWLALFLLLPATLRSPARVGPMLPWFHVMGSLAGLHLAFSIERYGKGVAAFQRMFAALLGPAS